MKFAIDFQRSFREVDFENNGHIIAYTGPGQTNHLGIFNTIIRSVKSFAASFPLKCLCNRFPH